MGYVQQDIYLTLWVGLAGTAITVLVIVPPWPVFNQHPEPWLRLGKGGTSRGDIVISGKKVQ